MHFFFFRIGKLWKYFKVSKIKAIWTFQEQTAASNEQKRPVLLRAGRKFTALKVEMWTIQLAEFCEGHIPNLPVNSNSSTVARFMTGFFFRMAYYNPGFISKFLFPKKWKNCWHGAPLLTAFICKRLSEHICSIRIKGSFFLQGYRVRGTFSRSGLARNWIRLLCCLGHAVQLVCAPRIQRGSSASEAFFLACIFRNVSAHVLPK